MTREDLIEAVQHYAAIYAEARDQHLQQLSKQKRVDYQIF